MVSFTSCYWGWEWDSSNTGIVSRSRTQTGEKNLTHCVILSSGYFKQYCLASFFLRNIPCDRSERRSGSSAKAGELERSSTQMYGRKRLYRRAGHGAGTEFRVESQKYPKA